MVRDPMIIRLEDRPREHVQAERSPEPPNTDGPHHEQPGQISLLRVGLLILSILLLVAVGIGAWYLVSGEDEVDSAQMNDLVGSVGLLMLLPSDEQPTVATVTNLDAVKDQPFFKNAQIGDIVLMYPKAKRAILYSPTENMIVEVAPIVIGDE